LTASEEEQQTMTESDATAVAGIVGRYFAVWNETDRARRRELIAATWSDDAGYVDPMFEADGAAGLDAMVARVQQQFPGHRFRLAGGIDAHHDRARWAWELAGPDGATVAAGVDFAVLTSDGRLRSVTGFLEAPAA
jgi:hypothetical protein